MKELYDFICHFAAFDEFGMNLMDAMNKVDQYMLNKAKEDLELFEKLKKTSRNTAL